MSTDTPRPERATLTDEERFDLIEQVGEWLPTGEGFANPQAWAIQVADHACEAFAPILAAREQALREEIAGQIEAKYLGPDSGRGYDGREAPDAALRNAYDEGLEHAARIARGGAR